MDNILVIDPGLHKCGYFAIVDGKVLWGTAHSKETGRGAAAWAGMIVALRQIFGAVRFDTLIVETMNVYEGSRRKGTPADLLQVQAVAGAVVGHFMTEQYVVHSYDAAVWTKGVPKAVRKNRIVASGDYPKECAPPLSEHDAWDAYGLYLYWRQQQ